MIRIAVCGAGGRMGRALIAAVQAAEGAELGAAIERPDSSLIGSDAGVMIGAAATGVAVSDAMPDALANAAVLVDFTANKRRHDACRSLGIRCGDISAAKLF